MNFICQSKWRGGTQSQSESVWQSHRERSFDIGKPLIGSISENNLANSPRIIPLIYENEQRQQVQQVQLCYLLRMVSFGKVPGGGGFIHCTEVRHLGLTVSYFVPQPFSSVCFRDWKLIPEDVVGKKPASWSMKSPYNSSCDYKRGKQEWGQGIHYWK